MNPSPTAFKAAGPAPTAAGRSLLGFLAFVLAAFLAAAYPRAALAEKAPPDATLTGHKSAVLAIAFSPDGKRLATAGDDGLLKVWDLAAKRERCSYEGVKGNQNQVRFTPDGKAVVALGSDSNVIVVDSESGKPVRSIALSDMTGGASALDLSPDGKTLAVVGRGTLRLFDLAKGTQKSAYEVHKGYQATAVAFSPDGSRLATVGSDNTLLLLDAATGNVSRTLKLSLNGELVAFSPDGKTLYAAASDRTLRAYDAGGEEPKTLVNQGIELLTMQVSADGKSLVLGGTGSGPWVVSLPDGTLTDGAYQSEDRLKSAAISPDGKWLAGGGNGGAVYVWKARE